jgi:hypothetical protein
MADEGFLQRWSRRKAEARTTLEERDAAQDAVAERAPAPETADPPAVAAPGDARAWDDEAAVDLEALPDIETLTYESDFTVFMRKGVPAELRKRALQRLWRSHPTLANLDGLLEYGEDYTKIGTAQQVVRTAYQVGRGMLGQLEVPSPHLPGARSPPSPSRCQVRHCRLPAGRMRSSPPGRRRARPARSWLTLRRRHVRRTSR